MKKGMCSSIIRKLMCGQTCYFKSFTLICNGRRAKLVFAIDQTKYAVHIQNHLLLHFTQ